MAQNAIISNETQIIRKKAPRIPPVPQVPEPPKREEEKTLLDKLKDMDKLISWIIVAAVIAFPLVLFANMIIYWYFETYTQQSFFVYDLESDLQLVWNIILYVTCVIGLVLARLAAGIYFYIKDQAYFNG